MYYSPLRTLVRYLGGSDPHSALPRPAKELEGFGKVHLKPGESRRVNIELGSFIFSNDQVEIA